MGAKRCLCLLGCCACLTTWAGPGEPVKLDVTRDIEAPEIAQHNATGDGLTDDTEALQAAIHHVAQAGGGTVALPAGTYRIAALEIGEGVRLVGEGPGKTVLRVFEGSPYALIALTGGSLELLSVYGTPTEDMSGDHWKVGAGGKGIGSTALPVHLIHVREAMHGALLRNVHALESRYDCLYVRGSKGLRVEGCLFNRAGRNVVSMVGTDEDFRFSDCTFGSLWGLYLFDIEPAGGPYVRNGVIERCTFDGREAGRMDTDTWGSFLCFSGHPELKSGDITVRECTFRRIYVRVREVFPKVRFIGNTFDVRGFAFVRVQTNAVGEFRDAVVRGNTFLVQGKPAKAANFNVIFSGETVFEDNTPAGVRLAPL